MISPLGISDAATAFADAGLLLAGVGVGDCSLVVPHVSDQLAMAHSPRASFAPLLALLPAVAAVVGAVVLRQVPTSPEVAGVALLVLGVTSHQLWPTGREQRAGGRAARTVAGT